ncbi:polysaccharide deacetylase family protein [Streptosporangium subroseum]|uniref:polysaccharide deacetylase family protein n=1 Tax=Streptosporangium subroseum TaxID=106412 RepID=UPI00308B8BCC|nr:polysaccharide deacetylase family protein [Streptosporangium subroseum]
MKYGDNPPETGSPSTPDDAGTAAAIGRRPVLRLGAAATLGTVIGCSGEPEGAAPEPAARTSAPTRSGTIAPSPPVNAAPPARLPAEVRHGPRDRPQVALTFHGAGPVQLAENVLATAERSGVRLTILAVGSWLERYPGMARRVLSGGHDLGNHTQNHLDICGMDERAAHAEIAGCATLLRELTGSIGSWFRPSATQQATPLVRRLSARVGYRTCLSYDLDSRDHTDPGPAAIVSTVLDNVRPGSIVSLHLGRPGTAKALPEILDSLRRRRLRAVTVTELLTR